MSVSVDMKSTKEGASFTISGANVSGLDVERVSRALESRLACMQANRCNSREQSVQEKLACVSERGRRRFSGTEVRFTHGGAQLTVKQAGKNVEIQLSGPEAKSIAKLLKDKKDLQTRIEAEIACQKANRCGTVEQTAEQKVACITTTAKRRFGVK